MSAVTVLAAGVSSAFLFLITWAGVRLWRRIFGRHGSKDGQAVRSEAEAGEVKGLNDVIAWTYDSASSENVDRWTEVWTTALTQTAKTLPGDFQVRFEQIRIDRAPLSPPLRFSGLSTQLLSADDKSLTVRANVLCEKLELILSVTPRSSKTVCSIDCRVNAFEFQARMEGVFMSTEDVSRLSLRFQSEPKMRLEVKPNQEVNLDVETIERLVRDVVARTEVEMPLWTNRPQGRTTNRDPFESKKNISQTQSAAAAAAAAAAADHRSSYVAKKKLLVKIIKASGLVASQEYGTLEPFCVASLDSPLQRYTTSSVKNTTNPFFDEHFVFDIDPTTKKLTLELHDREKPETDDFLGSAVLAVDDFSQTRHVLPLTGRGPMTYGALTIEVSMVDPTQVSVQSLSPNVEHISPPRDSSGEQSTSFNHQVAASRPGSASPTVTVSEADTVFSDPAILTDRKLTETESRDSKSLPARAGLPPKGDGKRKSLVGAIKKRFQRKKTDSRSQSADRAREKSSGATGGGGGGGGGEAGGIYLTPPPSRASPSANYDDPSSGGDVGSRSRSNSLRSNLRRLFHVKRQEDSPTRLSTRGVDPSPEGSIGHPSPRLHRPSSSGRSEPHSSAQSMTSTVYEQQIR